MSQKFLDRMTQEERDDYHRELFGKEEWDEEVKKRKENDKENEKCISKKLNLNK